MSLCPEKFVTWFSSPHNDLQLSPKSIRSSFPLLKGLSSWKSPPTLFRPNWVKYYYNLRWDRKNVFSNRSGIVTQLDRKSADGDFLQLGHWTSVKQLWIELGETPNRLSRGRPISNTFGANAHANVLKGTFLTGCKSSCIGPRKTVATTLTPILIKKG